MGSGGQKRIVRLLGIGFDAEDGHVRITHGERFDVLMGSDESHEFMHQFIERIENYLKQAGLKMEDLTAEELAEFVKSMGNSGESHSHMP